MPEHDTEVEGGQPNWEVATTRRKKSQKVAAQHARVTVWQCVQQQCGHLLAVAAKLGLERGCLLEALIMEALATTAGIEAFSKAESTHQRHINELAFATTTGDVHTFLEVMRAWTGPVARQHGARGATKWCQEKGINERTLKVIERRVQRTYAQIQQLAPKQFLPRLHFSPESKKASSGLITDIVARALAHNICVHSGDNTLGYVEICSGDYIHISDMSVLNFLPELPLYVVYVDAPSMSSLKCHLVVIPDTVAMEMIGDITGLAAEEAIARLVPQPIVFRDVGRTVQRRLKLLWDATEGQRVRSSLCCNTCCLLKLDENQGTAKVLCMARYHADVHAATESLIQSIRTQIEQESFVVNHPFPWSKLSLALDSGVSCRCPLAAGDFVSLALRHVSSGGDFSESDVITAFKDFGIDIKKDEDDEKVEGSIWGVLTFKNSTEAARAHKEVFCKKFMLEPRCIKGLKPPLAKVTQTVTVKVKWPKAGNAKPATDPLSFKRELWKSLEDVSQEKWRGTVYLTDDESQPYGAWLTTTDCTTAMRVASFLRTVEVCGHQVHVTNDEEVQEQLRSFSIDMDNRVYAVTKDAMWSRLGNLMQQEGSKMTCQELEASRGYCRLKVQCGDPQLARHVMGKLQKTVKPHRMSNRHNNTGYNHAPLLPQDRDVLLRKITSDTQTHIEVDDFSDSLYIYGSKAARKEALKSLETCISGSRKWFITRLFDGQYRPDALMRLVKSKGSPADIASDLKVDAIEVHPKEGYIMHRTDRYYMRETNSGNVKKGLEFLRSQQSLQEEVDCAACFGPTARKEAYFLERCGHAYCRECLTSQIQTSLDNTIFPLCCASCDSAFACHDLFNICGRLKLFKLAAVLRGSLRLFVNSNLRQYRCCPHLSCEGIVDVTAEGQLRCALCQRCVCHDCHEMLHEDKSCEEFGSAKRMLQAWIQENPGHRKQCPNCEIGIEKVDGCDNVYCTACQRNICWECMAHFGDADQCYDHLEDEHEGI